MPRPHLSLARRSAPRVCGLLAAACVLGLVPVAGSAEPISVLTVDVTPFVSPGPSRFGPTNTMGMALQKVDTGGLFAITEVTPQAFRAMSAQQLATFDLIALNNHPERLETGIGTTWHPVVGVVSGGRVLLNSHDDPRFHLNTLPGSFMFENPGPGEEPFGAPELLRQAALWAGGVPGTTGFMVFNDAPFFAFAGGLGWDNLQLRLPPEWGISDLDAYGGLPLPGDGYTDILPAFESHPLYLGLSDVRFAVGSITTFGSHVTAGSFHTAIASYEPGIFTPTEVIVNAGDPNPGDLEVGGFLPPLPGLDGRAITLMREAGPRPPGPCDNGLDDDGDGDADHPADDGCLSAVDLSEEPDCSDGLDNDGDGAVDADDDRCDGGPSDRSERSDCMDGLDNDGDGLVDTADDGCLSHYTLSELPDCMDGLDNDGDTFVDFPDDVGCRDASYPIENPICNDNLDNDGDGRVDFDGAAWFDLDPRTEPDPGCAGYAWRQAERVSRCGLGAELALPLVALGLRLRRRR